MEMLDRLKQLYNDNPDMRDALESKFPELEDKNPYIIVNQLFMRKGRPTSLYQLVRTKGNNLSIKNVTDNVNWSNTIEATNQYATSRKDFYLTRKDFVALLKNSGVKIDSLQLLYDNSIKLMYRVEWEE